MDLIQQTWQELGIKGVRPTGRTVFVRTMSPPKKTDGGIWLPPSLTLFHAELPHRRTVRAIVLAAGPKAELKPGDEVCFMRLHFTWWKKLDEEQMVGWIDETQIAGYVQE